MKIPDEGGERVMLKCRDCLHWEVCTEYRGAFWGHKAQYRSPIVNASADSCMFYKNRGELLDEDGRPLTLGRVLSSIRSAARYNGLDEIITSWAKLKDEDGTIGYPDYENPDYPEWARNQLQVYWMICVLMFGNYGTSPRYGWITEEAAASFREFCKDFKRRKDEETK